MGSAVSSERNPSVPSNELHEVEPHQKPPVAGSLDREQDGSHQDESDDEMPEEIPYYKEVSHSFDETQDHSRSIDHQYQGFYDQDGQYYQTAPDGQHTMYYQGDQDMQDYSSGSYNGTASYEGDYNNTRYENAGRDPYQQTQEGQIYEDDAYTQGECIGDDDHNDDEYEGDDDEVIDEEDDTYKQAYNEGYYVGYDIGYKKASEESYEWYQNEVQKMNRDSKYHFTYDKLPKNTKKFWKQRYSLFKKFDQGVYMTEELWYSVTPEAVALFVAKFILACAPNLHTIADICCGGGGNSIQFAKRFDKVIALDINDDNLFCTRKNCELYGVGDKVEYVQGDWTKLIGTPYYNYLQREVDLVFCSPPWGGPGYKGKDSFDLSLLLPMPIDALLLSFRQISSNIVLFLPRNSDLVQLSQVTKDVFGKDAKCRILYTYCDGFIKGIIAFWGEQFMPENYKQPTDGGGDAPELVNNVQFEEAQAYSDTQNSSAYASRNERDTSSVPKAQKSKVIELDY